MKKSESPTELKIVRSQIRVGAEQLDRGETVEGEEVFRRWRSKHQHLARGLRKTLAPE